MLDIILVSLQVVLAVIGVYQFGLALFGMYKKKRKGNSSQPNLLPCLSRRTTKKKWSGL